LANHGAVCYGESVAQAYARMETLEHLARIALVAEMLGGPKVLPRVEIEKLFEARARYGVKVPNGFEPGSPMAAEDMPDPGEKLEVTRQQLLALIDEGLRVRGVAQTGSTGARPRSMLPAVKSSSIRRDRERDLCRISKAVSSPPMRSLTDSAPIQTSVSAHTRAKVPSV